MMMERKKRDRRKSGKGGRMGGKRWSIVKSESRGLVMGVVFVMFGV